MNNCWPQQIIMNRKNKDKENTNKEQKDQTDGLKYVQPITPKFNPNWAQGLRFDRIFINICDCTYQVVSKVAKQLKWKIQSNQNSAQWDVWWTDWHVLPQTLMKMQHHQKINHFPGMFVLSRKNMLAKNLMKLRKKAPQQYSFFPLTWNLPLEFPDFKAYYETKPKGKARTYIVKPESLSQGKGIFLTRKIEEINPSQHCVVQRYISKPYLVDGLKFDLRVYVLVAGVDPLRVYVYKQGLARFATQQYIVPNKDNITDVFMHLTNYAINKESQKFVFNEDSADMSTGHKRSINAIYDLLAARGADVPQLKQKINQLIVKTLISGMPHLRFLYRSCQPQNYRSDMCFQILGFDVLLSEELQPILLQINYTPSFSTDTPLDQTIKKNLIKDTLVLMEINKSMKQNVVKQRKDYRQQRMMTGKNNKLTPAEKAEKKEIMMKERDDYIDAHLGGFTKIYPLDSSFSEENRNQMQIYENMIRFSEQNFGQVKKVSKKEPSIQNNQKSHKKSIKLQKLPSLGGTTKQNILTKKTFTTKLSEKRIGQSNNLSKKQIEMNSFDRVERNLDKTSNMIRMARDRSVQQQKVEHSMSSSNQNREQIPSIQELSVKALHKIKLKQLLTNSKKTVQTRQFIVPKTIQFQGNKFDGLSEHYVRALKRNQ